MDWKLQTDKISFDLSISDSCKNEDMMCCGEKYPYSEFFWSAFSCIRTEYGEILRISPYSARMQENTN